MEYHFQVFFKDNMEIKTAFLPEIVSLRPCMPRDGYVVRVESIKHHILVPYSLSCLDSFFTSLENPGLDGIFGDLEDIISRRRGCFMCSFFA